MNKKLVPEDYVLAAVIGSAHGLRGEVVVDVRSDRPEKTLVAGCQVATEMGALTIARNREYKGRIYLLFAEINTREDAEAARGLELFVPQEFEDNAWYEDQLVGLLAKNPQGQVFGSVVGLETGVVQDLLIVELQSKELQDEEHTKGENGAADGANPSRADSTKEKALKPGTAANELEPELDALDSSREQIGNKTGCKVLVPFVEAIVPTVDVANGYVTIDAPAGLFDQTL